MIICLCRSLTKKEIEKEIINGCQTFEQLMKKVKAPDDCKICYQSVKKIFKKLKNKREG